MKHKTISDEKLKALLKSMPEIQDKQTMQDIYEKVSLKLSEGDRPKKWRKWMVPAFTTAAILFLAVFIYTAKLFIPMGNESADQDHGFSTANDSNAESFIMNEEEESEEYGMESITPDFKEFAPYQLFGLEIGMPYLEALNIIGEPSQTDEIGNRKVLFFKNAGAGIELTLDEYESDITEYIFYPANLKNHKILSELPENKEAAINFFGPLQNATSLPCKENNCEKYEYLMPNMEKIIVTFNSSGEVKAIVFTMN